ncbi:arylsulfatase [Planctomicrobium sp. SH661]|uniref:arylsulfatase n=1 Tax=Planctomicrobium sp. SH661 TaxID=3448124 RepID=UPI003F5AFAF3
MLQRHSNRMQLFDIASVILRAASVIVTVHLSGVVFGDEPTAATTHPNVVVFLADDAGWGDYPLSGNRDVDLPHISSIAQQGVSLEQFFVSSLCSPTRAEFLTGRYHPRTGVTGVSTGRERMNLDERTIADVFHAAGYATGAFGKWHNGSQWPYHPRARGFDRYFGHTAGHWGEYFDAPLENDHGEFVRPEGYIVDVCTDEAVRFIESNRSRPFLCYIPFTTPHSPWAVPEEDWQRFRHKPITQRATLPEEEDVDVTRCVLAMLENQDANVGRVLAELEKWQLTDNTIVVYFSDNGPNSWRWNGGMKGRKGSIDEGGVRAVCYLRWPGHLPAGEAVSPIAGAIDLLPTLTSLAGIPLVCEKPLDGVDLSSLLKNPHTSSPDRLLFSTWGGGVSVRSQTHRLDREGQLFDMRNDPGQTTPLNEQEPDITARLKNAVADWTADVLAASRSAIAAPRGKKNIPDPRPIAVGYPEFPVTILPARDGEPRGEIQRSSPAPNCSYFVNWTRLDDEMVWLIDVRTPGRYAASVDYTCPLQDAGATIELSHGKRRLTGKVEPGWDPPLYSNQDTLPRPAGESQMKEFRTLTLGEIDLDAGQGPLVLKALHIPGKSVMDVRRVTLKLIK